jgi:hypothetical protein
MSGGPDIPEIVSVKPLSIPIFISKEIAADLERLIL